MIIQQFFKQPRQSEFVQLQDEQSKQFLGSSLVWKTIAVYFIFYSILSQITALSTLWFYIFCLTVENKTGSDIVLIMAFTLFFLGQRFQYLFCSEQNSIENKKFKFFLGLFFFLFGELEYVMIIWNLFRCDLRFQNHVVEVTFRRIPLFLMVIISGFCLSGDTSNWKFLVVMAIVCTFFTLLIYQINELCLEDFNQIVIDCKELMKIILQILIVLLHYSVNLGLIISNRILIQSFITFSIPFYLIVACIFCYTIYTKKRRHVERHLINISLYFISPLYALLFQVGFDPRFLKQDAYPISFKQHGKYFFDSHMPFLLVLQSFQIVIFILGLILGQSDELQRSIGSTWIVILCITSILSIWIYLRNCWILKNEIPQTYSMIEAYAKDKLTNLFEQDQLNQIYGKKYLRFNVLLSQVAQPGLSSQIDKQIAIDCVLCGFPGVDFIYFGGFISRIKQNDSSKVEIKIYYGLEMIKNSMRKYKCLPKIRQLEVLLMNSDEELELVELFKANNLMIQIFPSFPWFDSRELSLSYNRLIEYLEVPFFQIVAFYQLVAPYQTFNTAYILYDLYD